MMQLSQCLERTHEWVGMCEEEELQLQIFAFADNIGYELL